jgi:hypothetical protein
MSAEPLYRRILGAAWDDLDEAVRRAHADDSAPRASGTLRVWHRPGHWPALLLHAARLPAAGQAVPVQLAVEPVGDGERYCRSFGGAPLVSFQRQAGPGLIDERFGPFEIRFRLSVEAGALRYQQIGAALWLGSRRLPLPLRLLPRAHAREVGDGPSSTQLLVEIRWPGSRPLFSYEGRLAWRAAAA